MKILFLVPYSSEGASNRIRVEQFLPYLRSKGIDCGVRPFVNRPFFKILYLPSRYIEKFFWFMLCTINRLFDILRAIRYDVIFIHREAYPFGGALIESILYKMGKYLIYDFDDAIFLPSTSRQNIYINRFKNPGKISSIIRMSKRVIAGNNYLRDFSLQFNKNTIVIPSSVDTVKYIPAVKESSARPVVVGWIGSSTTVEFLRDLEEVFFKLSNLHKNLVFKIVGAAFDKGRLRNVVNKKWSLEEELSDLQSFDIGIMPMPDDLWTKGKCGFKAILYMACGLPVVSSPVGANLEIIDDGINGFFAKNTDEWLRNISRLIEDRSLRKAMGLKGREKVVEKYSLTYTSSLFYEALTKIYAKK